MRKVLFLLMASLFLSFGSLFGQSICITPNQITLTADCSEELKPNFGEIKYLCHLNNSEGWVKCDGESYPKASYPKAYENIGGIYGEDSVSFKVPLSNSSYELPHDTIRPLFFQLYPFCYIGKSE